MDFLEIIFWSSIVLLAYVTARNRFRSALRQIEMENAVRTALIEMERKRKIDRLYGRNDD